MAITASFAADFSQFNGQVKDAGDMLTTFEGTVDKTSTAIQNMGTKTTTTAEKNVSNLARSFNQFDSALSTSGVHLGPWVKGLDEFAAVAGKSAKELGAVTTAGLAFVAFEKGWQVGRKIADYFKTDETIGNAIAKWMGWGDVAKETAGAVADAMALASQRAGREITSMNEAVQINTNW